MDPNSINIKMTAQQVAERFGYSLASVQTKFKRTQQSIKKKFGVEVIKCQGLQGTYYMISDERALTMFDEVKNELYIPLESLKIENFILYVLIGIAATPQGTFRGTRKEFLKYMGVAASQKNEELFDKALILLMNLNIIIFDIDEDIITAHMKKAFENITVIPNQMLKQCQRIIQENHKQNIKIVQLVKIWQAHRLCEKNQPFTLDDIQHYIDLSKDQIKDGRKLLQQSDIFKLSAAMLQGQINHRVGTNIQLNGIYDQSEVNIKK